MHPRDEGRCRRCFLRPQGCLCAQIPHVAARTELVIVRHALERHKVSNTGRLAALAVPGTRLVDHAVQGAPAPTELLLPEDGVPTFLLYPEGPTFDAPPALPLRLVVLDGTWPQARRMLQRLTVLRGLPRLALPAPVLARRRLRRTKRAPEMSTLEAIATALGWLEGDDLAAPLFALHDLFVERATPPYADRRGDPDTP